MKKRPASLRGSITLLFFTIMVVTFFLIAVAILLGARMHFIKDRVNPFFAAIVIAIFVCILGSIITAISLKSALRPIKNISQATKEVAKGNFNVRIDENADDTTELGQLTVNFNKMVAELGSIESLRSDFISNVSHEFKTPLSSMQGYATLLQDDDITPEERREYSRMIIDDAKQLSELTSNILFLSRIENQGIAIERSTFRLDESLRRAILMLQHKWEAKEQNISPNLDSVTYTGSESMLMQAWINLLDNAIKFTPVGGSISVELRADVDNAVVDIIDSGCGMDEETLHHMFEKFYQGNRARSSEGNGLGLSLVQRIVALEGGNIFAESSLGVGTAFTVTLPLRRHDEPSQEVRKFRRK